MPTAQPVAITMRTAERTRPLGPVRCHEWYVAEKAVRYSFRGITSLSVQHCSENARHRGVATVAVVWRRVCVTRCGSAAWDLVLWRLPVACGDRCTPDVDGECWCAMLCWRCIAATVHVQWLPATVGVTCAGDSWTSRTGWPTHGVVSDCNAYVAPCPLAFNLSTSTYATTWYGISCNGTSVTYVPLT